MGEVASGLIATVPLIAGGLLQLVAPVGIRWIGSARRWTVLCAGAQAATFVPLVAIALGTRIPHFTVFLMAMLYWATGMAMGPAWNVWVERLVPATIRTRYFARRSSAAQFGVLAGFLSGGLVLQIAASNGRLLLGFATMFALAATSRAISMVLLAKHSAVPLEHPVVTTPRPTLQLLRRFPRGQGARLLLYMLGLTAMVSIASPYFSAYMLRELGLSYAAYVVLVGTSLVAKVVSLPLLGNLVRARGLTSVIRFAWAGIALVPALWVVSDFYPYLIALQILAGFSWAAHEYATFLLLFETVRAERRTSILTVYNFGFAIVTAGGALLGALLFQLGGQAGSGYALVFATSALGRAACLVLLVGFVAPVPTMRRPAFRLVAVRPATGAVLRPILATLRARRQAGKATDSRARRHSDPESPPDANDRGQGRLDE
jgi:MFS family permease